MRTWNSNLLSAVPLVQMMNLRLERFTLGLTYPDIHILVMFASSGSLNKFISTQRVDISRISSHSMAVVVQDRPCADARSPLGGRWGTAPRSSRWWPNKRRSMRIYRWRRRCRRCGRSGRSSGSRRWSARPPASPRLPPSKTSRISTPLGSNCNSIARQVAGYGHKLALWVKGLSPGVAAR